MENLLLSLGINISSNLIYDFLIKNFSIKKRFSKDEIVEKLSSFLDIKNSNIYAEKIIEFLAKNGDIKIEGTLIYSNSSIAMFSSPNNNFVVGNNSSSKTKNTNIDYGNGAYAHMQGGAGIQQNEDGSISFYA